MPIIYDWRIQRSGPGLRITGTYFDGVSLTTPNYRLTGITSIEAVMGDIVAFRRNVRVCILSTTGNV